MSPSLSCTHTAANGNAKVPKYLLDAVNGNCSRFIRLQHAARTERSFVCPSVLPSVRLSACPPVCLSLCPAAKQPQPNALVSVAFQNWPTGSGLGSRLRLRLASASPPLASRRLGRIITGDRHRKRRIRSAAASHYPAAKR